MSSDSGNQLSVTSYKQFLNYPVEVNPALAVSLGIHISQNKKWIMSGIISIQIFLMLATYNAITAGVGRFAEFFLGVNLLVFVALYFVYKSGQNTAKESKSIL